MWTYRGSSKTGRSSRARLSTLSLKDMARIEHECLILKWILAFALLFYFSIFLVFQYWTICMIKNHGINVWKRNDRNTYWSTTSTSRSRRTEGASLTLEESTEVCLIKITTLCTFASLPSQLFLGYDPFLTIPRKHL